MGTEGLPRQHCGNSNLDALLLRPPPSITVLQGSAPAVRGSSAPAQTSAQTLSLPDPATLLKAKVRLAMNRVMAIYLSSWEETADSHDEAMGRLIDALPADQRAKVVLADGFGETRFETVRRHVLKVGNDSCRELDETIDHIYRNTISQ